MKIFLGEKNSCALNYQHILIYSELAKLNKPFEITTNVSDADIIVIAETCCCTKYNIKNTLEYINYILKNKKKDAKIFLTGCITRKFKDNIFLGETEKWIKNNIDFIIPQNQPYLLLKLIAENEFNEIDENDFGLSIGDSNNSAEIFISNGCLNNCSFCKVTFQKYPLKSVPFNEVINSIDLADSEKYSEILLKGTNICQYGFDLYNEFMLPEIISYIEKKENIKEVVLIGFAFKDAIKNDFESVLSNSTKVKEVCGSLESGSDRLLELMKKGFTSEEIITFVKNIRKNYPKKLLLNIIAGFPTETLADVKTTLEILKELDPYLVDICRYTDSEFVDSHIYEQLSPSEIQEHTRIYSKVLQKRKVETLITGRGYKYN